jgi:predicted phage baseplate assembly protein
MPALESDPLVAEIVFLDHVDDTDLGHTKLVFALPLTNRYDRASVTVYANVAGATHGETVAEILGSGNAAAAFRSFQLRQRPLTYTLAPTPSGATSTLKVFINDIPWREAETLYAQGPIAKLFATRRDDAGNTSVQFGDGATYGARPPSGTANVRAEYWRGLGVAGNVKARQLTTLLSRPLGLKEAVNPLPGTGGIDPEPLGAARINAPRSVATLDRAVSLTDYEAFARSFAGIAKAVAAWGWDGLSCRVVLTLAGARGEPVPPNDALARNLAAALASFGDPTVPFLLQSYAPATFRLGLRIHVFTQSRPAATQAAVEAALRKVFGFDARDFGQAVTLSEVLAVVQEIENVAACQITALFRTGQANGLATRLVAAGPQSGGETKVAAEILTLDPGPLVESGVMP